MNYIYPAREALDAEARAIDRDLVDSERLAHFQHLVADLLDAVLPDAHAIGHPCAKWHPDDLIDVLQGQLTSIRWELARLRGPLVLEGE